MSADDQPVQRPKSYLRLLMVLLGTATFFEGYDSAINAVVLRDLARDFGVSLESTGKLSGPIIVVGLGAFGALIVTTIGDRIGRRPVLIATTFLYAVFTGLTATADSIASFVIFQFFARTFLVAEYSTAITIVTEEFPASRRGSAMGALTALSAFGLPLVALLHLAVKDTALGWRTLYLVGLLPLVFIGFLRFRLKETQRWVQAKREGRNQKTARWAALAEILGPAHRNAFIKISAIFFLTHVALLSGLAWWPYYASVQREFPQTTITVLLAGAYPLGVAGYFVAGKLQDRVGRRPTGVAFMALGLIFALAVFQTGDPRTMFVLMVFSVFFGLGVNPVLNSVVGELFPTSVRATAVAFARSIFGTIGGVVGPAIVGLMADRGLTAGLDSFPVLGNLGHSVSVMLCAYIPAGLLLWALPETAGKELESISKPRAVPNAPDEINSSL